MQPQFSALCETLKERPLVMGILNVTPDSFSDGGLWQEPAHAVKHARSMVKDGADIIDVGGESTRPGAPPVGLHEELDRVLPVIRGLRLSLPGTPLSIDTMKAEVARQAVAAGACMVNDVSALTADPAMLGVLESCDAGLCIMHRLEAPEHAKWAPNEASRYGPQGVTAEVGAWLKEHLDGIVAAGIDPQRVWLDPGLGFGKSVGDNLRLLRQLGDLAALGRPLLVGASRKSFLGAALGGLPLEERLEAGLAAGVVALMNGARILRVHDVKAAARCVAVVQAIRNS